MISANEEGEIGCFANPAVVPMEITYLAEFLRDGHGVEIVGVPDCLSLLGLYKTFFMDETDLEVASNDEEVNAIPPVDFA